MLVCASQIATSKTFGKTVWQSPSVADDSVFGRRVRDDITGHPVSPIGAHKGHLIPPIKLVGTETCIWIYNYVYSST